MSSSFKNFILFCYATIISVGIFMLAAMIFDLAITPKGQTTPNFHMCPAPSSVGMAIFWLSMCLLIAVYALVIVFRSRLIIQK